MRAALRGAWCLSAVLPFTIGLVRAQTLDPLAGRTVYQQHCAACHGDQGDGVGPAAVWLFPKPRNFSSGLFKIQSTPAETLPTDEDLYQTVTRGMPGSSMPSFQYLSEADRRAAVQQVKYLTAEVATDGTRKNHFEEAARNGRIGKPVEVPPEPASGVETLTAGRELFVKFACNTCHGDSGAGDGPSAPTLKDTWGLPLPPRDFNTGAFRGGHTGPDLYRRINNGLPGTPMPAFGEGVMKPEERWALVHFVQSLRRKEVEVNDILAPEDGRIRATRVARVPEDPNDAAWEGSDVIRIPLNPLWPEPKPIVAVAIRAVHDGKRLGIQCTWRDPIADQSAIRVQDFQDAMALQFSLKGTTPFLGMGDAANPVNLWFWRAGWQLEVEGRRPEVAGAYPSMHADVELSTNVLYRTAEAAGNLVSLPHASAVEDANARGFGTLTSQPLNQQNVQGRGTWFDEHWSVVFWRDLDSSDPNDVTLAISKPVPVAFAVWNGGQRDRNGRKVISNWYQLVLEP